MNSSTLKKLLAGRLDDMAVEKALRAAGGDPASAIRSLVDDGRKHLIANAPHYEVVECDQLRAELLASGLRQRSDLLRLRAADLLEVSQTLSDTSAFEREVTRARKAFDYYRLAEQPDLAEETKRKLVRVEVELALQPNAVAIVRRMANAAEALQQDVEGDLRLFGQLIALCTERRTQHMSAADGSLLPEEWVPDADVLRRLAGATLRRHLDVPVGALSHEDPAALLERLVAEVRALVPVPPGLAHTLRNGRARSYLNSLSVWAGTNQTARYLWKLQQPVAVVQAPPRMDVTDDCPAGCSVRMGEGSPHAITVRIFKFLPLAAIDGWKDWCQASTELREAHGGFAATSAEPWRADERRETAEQFDRVHQMGGKIDGSVNGAVSVGAGRGSPDGAQRLESDHGEDGGANGREGRTGPNFRPPHG